MPDVSGCTYLTPRREADTQKDQNTSKAYINVNVAISTHIIRGLEKVHLKSVLNCCTAAWILLLWAQCWVPVWLYHQLPHALAHCYSASSTNSSFESTLSTSVRVWLYLNWYLCRKMNANEWSRTKRWCFPNLFENPIWTYGQMYRPLICSLRNPNSKKVAIVKCKYNRGNDMQISCTNVAFYWI